MMIESRSGFQRTCCSEGKNYHHHGREKKMEEKDWDIHLYAMLTCQIKRKDFKTPLVIALEGDIIELVFLTSNLMGLGSRISPLRCP